MNRSAAVDYIAKPPHQPSKHQQEPYYRFLAILCIAIYHPYVALVTIHRCVFILYPLFSTPCSTRLSDVHAAFPATISPITLACTFAQLFGSTFAPGKCDRSRQILGAQRSWLAIKTLNIQLSKGLCRDIDLHFEMW